MTLESPLAAFALYIHKLVNPRKIDPRNHTSDIIMILIIKQSTKKSTMEQIETLFT